LFFSVFYGNLLGMLHNNVQSCHKFCKKLFCVLNSLRMLAPSNKVLCVTVFNARSDVAINPSLFFSRFPSFVSPPIRNVRCALLIAEFVKMADEVPLADSEDVAEPENMADAADSDSDQESDESAESDNAAEAGGTADSDYVPESDESAESDNAAEPDERAGTAYVLAKVVADSDEDTDVGDTAEEGKLRYAF
jgi:hypothetical protein